MSRSTKLKSKLELQLKRVRDKIKRNYEGYSNRLFSSNFDTAQFIESCYLGQQAFKRKDDEERAKELITFVIEKIKDSMKTVETKGVYDNK